MRILVDTIRYCHEMQVVHRDIKVELDLIFLAIKFTVEQ